MKRFIREHEQVAEAVLARGDVPRGFRAYHERQVGYLQAERFAHLLVMLSVAFFTLGAFLAVLLRPGTGTALVLGLLLVLLAPYVLHYLRLENAVQRWYRISRRLDRALGRVPGDGGPGAWG